jgi:hypothetical protein
MQTLAVAAGRDADRALVGERIRGSGVRFPPQELVDLDRAFVGDVAFQVVDGEYFAFPVLRIVPELEIASAAALLALSVALSGSPALPSLIVPALVVVVVSLRRQVTALTPCIDSDFAFSDAIWRLKAKSPLERPVAACCEVRLPPCASPDLPRL